MDFRNLTVLVDELICGDISRMQTVEIRIDWNRDVIFGIANIDEEQFIEGIHIYPTDYFCPKAGYGTNINITENTFAIHHYAASWVPLKRKIRGKVYYIIKRVAGDKAAEYIRGIVGRKN